MFEMHVKNLYYNISRGRIYLALPINYAGANFGCTELSWLVPKTPNHCTFEYETIKYAMQYSLMPWDYNQLILLLTVAYILDKY